MTASIENIVQHLFNQPSLQSVSVDELQQMTQEHPSFAAARFLLLKKMQDTSHPDFTSQLHKTSVYFNNPLWLQLLLSPMKAESMAWRPSNGSATEMIEHDTDDLYNEDPAAETVAEAGPSVEVPVQTEAYTEAAAVTDFVPETPVHTDIPAEAPAPAEETPAVVETQEDLPAEVSTQADEPVAQPAEPIMQEVLDRLRGQIQDAAGNDAPAETSAPSNEPVINEVLDRLREQIHEAGDLPPVSTAPVYEPVVQEVLDRLKGQIHDADAHEYPQPDISEEPAPDSRLQAPDSGTPAEIATQEDQPKEEDFTPIPDMEPAPAADLPIQKIIIETPMAQHDVLFEPYHTIDYFASQGIRLDKIEPAPKDKLGRQLKSFTEWLKSMKKLPQASIEKALGENEESAVVAAASHSIVGKEVITEAMAEVFEKQGMRDKAVEIYRKLSLLNPSKSSYFADRINALKYS